MRYFAVRVENQAAASSRVVVVVNGAGAREAPDGGCWSLACTLTLKCRRKATGVARGRCDHEDSAELPAPEAGSSKSVRRPC